MAGSQDFQEGTVVAVEVRGSQPPERSPHLAVSLAEGIPCPGKQAWQDRVFSKERASVGLIWALLDGPSTTWLPSRVGGSHLRTEDQLGPLRAAVFSGVEVKQEPAPLKAELGPS